MEKKMSEFLMEYENNIYLVVVDKFGCINIAKQVIDKSGFIDYVSSDLPLTKSNIHKLLLHGKDGKYVLKENLKDKPLPLHILEL